MPRMIDRNAHRWGAAISAVALLAAFAANWHPILPIMAAAVGVGPVFGLRYSPLGALYRLGKRIMRLPIAVEPEEESPPRFAQLMGLVFLGAGTVAFYGGHSSGAGWTLGLIVAGLQGLLAATGICIGCEMYLVGKRLAAKGV
ncbi:MAG: DUF4395 domain-containing protein [Actinomycetota bacterium]